MEKLTLKELAPYLPYGLKVTKEDWGKKGELVPWIMTLKDGLQIELDYAITTQAKPILRPLSDLTKEKFDDLFDSLSYQSKGLILREDLTGNWAESMRYYDFKLLLKNHFDVFNLIPKGLAIDKNTI